MSEAVHDAQRLLELQALPLERKIQITQARIIEWYKHYHGNVVVSFSGGKDSTVLLHLVRQLYPDVRAVFSNTGLEYPEIQRFVKSFPNVDIVTPKMRFDEVISHYGYPLISKEVAEAIYYARRLRSQNGNVERERERERESGARVRARKRAELMGRRTNGNGWIERFSNPAESYRGNDQPIHTHTHRAGPQAHGASRQAMYLETDRRRDNLSGKLHGRDWKSGGGESKAYPDEYSEKPEDSSQRTDARSRGSTDWKDWRRGCL